MSEQAFLVCGCKYSCPLFCVSWVPRGFCVLSHGRWAAPATLFAGPADPAALAAHRLLPLSSTAQFPAPFRRGRTWQLGPVLLRTPLFMAVEHLGELVTGYDPALGPVVGAVGHDLFFSATVHVSTMGERPCLRSEAGPCMVVRLCQAGTTSSIQTAEPL